MSSCFLLCLHVTCVMCFVYIVAIVNEFLVCFFRHAPAFQNIFPCTCTHKTHGLFIRNREYELRNIYCTSQYLVLQYWTSTVNLTKCSLQYCTTVANRLCLIILGGGILQVRNVQRASEDSLSVTALKNSITGSNKPKRQAVATRKNTQYHECNRIRKKHHGVPIIRIQILSKVPIIITLINICQHLSILSFVGAATIKHCYLFPGFLPSKM